MSTSSQQSGRKSRHTARVVKGSLLAALAVLTLSGCSVVSQALTSDEQAKLIGEEQSLLFKDTKPLEGPLTLHEAMARALKYNLDYRLKRMEEVVARNQEEVARLDMLPRWTLAAGYSARTPENASVSRSLSTGIVETDPSISREKATGTADFTMSWNLLDFGVSYYQARQEGNKRLIQGEQRRKAAHNLQKDVRFAYWRAVAAQGLEREVAAVLKSADEALATARKVEQEKLRSPVHALQFQLGLLEIVKQLERSRAELTVAKEELATLIHLPPGQPFELVDDGAAGAVPLELASTIDELERQALTERPELRIEQYQARIEADESRKAIARLFPGLEFDAGENFDGSRYLLYQHWAQAGARLSWNLLRALTAGSQADLSESREKVIQMRRLVMHMAIIGQTRIAYHEYLAARDGLKRIQEENHTRARLQGHAANRGELGLESQLSYVHTVASGVLGRVQQYESFARFQSAVGRLYATLGWDPLGEEGGKLEIAQLTRLLRTHDTEWQKRLFAQGDVLSLVDARAISPHNQPVSSAAIRAARESQRTGSAPDQWFDPQKTAQAISVGSADDEVAFATMPLPLVQPLARRTPPSASAVVESQPESVRERGHEAVRPAQLSMPTPVVQSSVKPMMPVQAEQSPVPSMMPAEALNLKWQAASNPMVHEVGQGESTASVKPRGSRAEQDEKPASATSQTAGNTPGEQAVKERRTERQPPPPVPTRRAMSEETRPAKKVRYAVQVASTFNTAGVDQLVERLRAKGYPLQIHETRDAEGRPIKQVWIGVYERNADARAARDLYQQREQQVGFVRVIQEQDG
ncbi:MAG: TolC family protein [Magnetococcus sp. YQC-9]